MSSHEERTALLQNSSLSHLLSSSRLSSTYGSSDSPALVSNTSTTLRDGRQRGEGDQASYRHLEHHQPPSVSDGSETLSDIKCRFIDREIEAIGMGKYQWCLWALCGLGYLVDLMWAQAFGLILSPMQQELGFGDAQTGNLSTAFSCGLTAGAFMWGILVDIIGRKWAYVSVSQSGITAVSEELAYNS